MSNIPNSFVMDGIEWKVTNHCDQYLFGQSGERSAVVPFGDTYDAQIKTVRGLNDAKGKTDRAARADALECFFWSCQRDLKTVLHGGERDLTADLQGYYAMVREFAILLNKAILGADETGVDILCLQFRNAVRSLRDGYEIERNPEALPRSKDKRRILMAIQLGAEHYHSTKEPPCKSILRQRLEELGLGYSRNEHWISFWRKCGLHGLRA